MTADTGSAVVPYLDINSAGFSVRSAQVMAAREQHWYARTNLGVAVLRYDEGNALLKDKRLIQGSIRWPQHYGITHGLLATWWADMLLSQEGQDHARLRRLANPAFSPRILEALTPDFTALANELVDQFSESGKCEYMAQFAEPYAARVICRLMSLPESEWQHIAELSTEIGLAFSVDIARELPRIESALQGLLDISVELIDRKRLATDDDFITNLVRANVEGDALSYDELLNMVSLMIFGGFDTTRNQLSLAMRTFAEHPEQWELLRQQPDLAKNAVEEVMRVNPTVTWVTRETATDFEYKDLTLPAGTTIHLFSLPAGSDPRKFEDPSFDITQQRAPHFGFGGGIHHCIGHFVARIDMREALKTLSSRMPQMRIGAGAQYLPDSGNTGAIVLPLEFTATPRLGVQ
jgi:cytochrome P450